MTIPLATKAQLDQKAPTSHEHPSTDILDFVESVQDLIATTVVAGANITVTYDDTTGSVTIAGLAGGGSDAEFIQDTVAAALVAGAGMTVTYDDVAGTITLASSTLAHTHAQTEISGLDTRFDNKISLNHGERLVAHDGTAGGGTRPTGYFRVRWVGGTTRPGNMAAGDIWEHDA